MGVLKGAVAVLLGFVLLPGPGGARFSALNVTGIGINLAGGTWYAWVQYAKSARATRTRVAAAEAEALGLGG